MSDIGVKNSRENMGGSSFECRTNFHRKNGVSTENGNYKAVSTFVYFYAVVI